MRISEKGSNRVFPHWLIMERSRDWPDLRSPISKIRNIQIVGIYTLMKSCKFQIFRIATVGWARLQTFLVVRSLNVTWWPDLTDLGSTFLHNVRNWCRTQFKKWRQIPHLFGSFIDQNKDIDLKFCMHIIHMLLPYMYFHFLKNFQIMDLWLFPNFKVCQKNWLWWGFFPKIWG